MFTLLQWSGTESIISLRYVCNENEKLKGLNRMAEKPVDPMNLGWQRLGNPVKWENKQKQ